MPEQRYSSRSGPKNSENRTSIFDDLTNELSWQARGSCAQPGSDPNWWFPVRGAVGADNTTLAKRVCAQCPVRMDCLTYITDNPQYGIWAGMTERERIHIGIGRNLG